MPVVCVSHTQKEYLIIIIISPKYYETVTASPVGLENDERTFNTVYIHKQVCGCKSEAEENIKIRSSDRRIYFAFPLLPSFCAAQLQNEFIQNGSKNFRFIPIVFPGAKKVSSCCSMRRRHAHRRLSPCLLHPAHVKCILLRHAHKPQQIAVCARARTCSRPRSVTCPPGCRTLTSTRGRGTETTSCGG